MTIQMLRSWGGLEQDSVQTLASPSEESRLIAAGLARNYTAGMDGSNPILTAAQTAAVQSLVAGAVNSISYNANGTVASATDNSGITSIGYDISGRPISVTAGGVTRVISYNGDGTIASVI